jgi:hypothetical protein
MPHRGHSTSGLLAIVRVLLQLCPSTISAAEKDRYAQFARDGQRLAAARSNDGYRHFPRIRCCTAPYVQPALNDGHAPQLLRRELQ